MSLPSFTITGTLLDLLGNTALDEIVGNGLGGATPATVTFTSNVPAGYFVTFDGVAYRVDPVTAEVNSDGTITRNGEDVLLLANDGGLSVDGVQWQAHVTGMNRFWFNAPVDGGTVNLGTVVPTPGIGVSGVAFSAGELVTLLADSESSVRTALDALYGATVDEYDEFANFAAFPGTGVLDRLYLAKDTGKLYRWTGSAYLQIADKTAVGLGNVDNTSDVTKGRLFGTQNRGNVAIWFGDSIGTAQDMIVGSANLVDHTIRSESTFAWASILSGQSLRYFRNASKGGDNASTAMARWDTDVAPYNFSVLVWALGTNDSFLQTTVAAYAALVKEAHAKTRAKGADFIICTIPPNDNLSNNPTNRKSLIVQYNQFLRDYAALHGLIVVDFFDLLSDTSGNYASGYSTDKTHPIAVGYRAMGALVADTLAFYLPPFSAPLPRTTTDANLVTEPLFLGGLNGSFVPTGWSMPSGVLRTGVTASLVTSDTDIKGNWFKMVVANTFSGPQTIFQTISSGITAGRKYRFIGRVKQIAPVGITITARIAYDAIFDYTGDATNTHEFRAMSGLGGAIPSGVFWFDSVAPVSAATAQINIQIVGNGGTGEVHLAQIGVYDITDVQAAL